jgi:hypothetical protein
MSSLTRLMVEVDVRTGWGKGADRKDASSATIFISTSRAMIPQAACASANESRGDHRRGIADWRSRAPAAT